MERLEAFAVSSLALMGAESIAAARGANFSIFQLNRVFQTAREQEISFENVTPDKMVELFEAANVVMPREVLDSSLRELRRRLGQDAVTSLSLGSVLTFFSIVCPWNSVDQIASLIVTTNKSRANSRGLTHSQVAHVLRIADVEQPQVDEYLANHGVVTSTVAAPVDSADEATGVVVANDAPDSTKTSSDKETLEAGTVDFENLLASLHEYPVFQEHTITHAKLKREAVRRFGAAAEYPGSSGPHDTLQLLARHIYDGNLVECLLKLQPSLPRPAISAYLAVDDVSRAVLLREYVDSINTGCGSEQVAEQLRVFFGPKHLQLVMGDEDSTLRLLLCVAKRMHLQLQTDDKANPSLLQTAAVVFAVLLLNEDLRSDSVSTSQKWSVEEFSAMLQPLQASAVASTLTDVYVRVRDDPLPTVFGDAQQGSGWMAKKTLLGAFRKYVDASTGVTSQKEKHKQEQIHRASCTGVKEVLANLQSSEDGKRIREACGRQADASLRAVHAELHRSTTELGLLHKLYQQLARHIGCSRDVDMESSSTDAAESVPVERKKALFEAGVNAITEAGRKASAQGLENRLIFYDIDRLETELQKLEDLVGWLDGYSIDLLTRAQASRLQHTPPR